MKLTDKIGRVFVAPLLGGGYAYGYGTANVLGYLYSNIYCYVGTEPTPPKDICSKPVQIHDLIVGEEFTLTPSMDAGEKWQFTAMTVPEVPKPRHRYVRMGIPPRRIDILGEEPDVPLKEETEVNKYPKLSKDFAPYPAALIEVTLKQLDMTPDELVEQWDASPSKKKKRKRTSRRSEKASTGSTVHIEIRSSSKGFPTPDELETRQSVEDALSERKLAKILSAGAGFGVMDIYAKPAKGTHISDFEAIVRELGIEDIADVDMVD